nr:immunoglobulin light chain junction region [Macaca mulatta]
CQKYNYSPWTF